MTPTASGPDLAVMCADAVKRIPEFIPDTRGAYEAAWDGRKRAHNLAWTIYLD